MAKRSLSGLWMGGMSIAAAVLMPMLAWAQPEAAAAAAAPPPPIDTGVTAWMLVSTALVLMMVPGLAMFYGGLVRTKNVVGTMMHSFAAMAIIGVLWVVCGYAMSFGTSHFAVADGKGLVGWDWSKFFLSGIDTSVFTVVVDTGETHTIPLYVFAMFQGKFAIITPALIAGAFAERVRFRGYCLFIALWSILIYNPLAHIVWGGGFLTGEAIDFAGGTVIHISAGVAGLVCAFYLGKRRGYPMTAMHPNNLVMTLMGAGFLWVGWFGFNAGSSVNSGMLTAQALTMTQIAAAAGACMWMLIEALHHKKATSLGFVSGMLAGLVAITPAAGDVLPWGAMVLGCVASVVCYGAIILKSKLGYDDSLDVFGIHGVAGIVGALGLTFLLRAAKLDMVNGSEVARSLGTQFWFQFKGVALSMVYSGVATLVLLVIVEKTVGFRMEQKKELAGMDTALHGEHGYGLLNLN